VGNCDSRNPRLAVAQFAALIRVVSGRVHRCEDSYEAASSDAQEQSGQCKTHKLQKILRGSNISPYRWVYISRRVPAEPLVMADNPYRPRSKVFGLPFHAEQPIRAEIDGAPTKKSEQE